MSKKESNGLKVTKAKKGQSFLELYQKSLDEKKSIDLSYSIHEWVEEGQTLVGKLLKVQKVNSRSIGGAFDGEVNIYWFDTDNGRTSCICGTYVDRLIDSGDYIGSIIALEYMGKEPTKDFRERNMFKVAIIG